MLNLSDKDLDRLSKEAAQEYEPGEILGPNSWEKLVPRLDSELGHVSPNPLRHIRRFPFYYAPALLVLLGISYYYLTKHPPSSRSMVKNSFTNQIPTNPSNSTPAAHSSANPTGPAPTDGSAVGGAPADNTKRNAPHNAPPSGKDASPSDKDSPASEKDSPASEKEAGSPASSTYRRSPEDRTSSNDVRSSGNSLSSNNRTTSNNRHSHNRRSSGSPLYSLNRPSSGNPLVPASRPASNPDVQTAQSVQRTQPAPPAPQPHELVRSTIGGIIATRTPADISDSALRAFTLKSLPPPIKRALYIRRDWQFGLMASPDFASVNALAGDKPGSSVGITVDYQFAPRWYISSGLLLDRRNYAARSQDFHPQHSFYQNNSIDSQNVDFVKGSIEMLEIPLNLRYDFSVTGNTLFFASAGVSSYLLSSENGNCYVNWYGREVPKGFQNQGPGNYLFSSMNLSLGVETGLSNSMSLLISPWLKMPLRTIGLGQLQMNSVGITFSLKWAPVTSRRRR